MKKILILLIIAFVIFSGCAEKPETVITSDNSEVTIAEGIDYFGYSLITGATLNFFALKADGSRGTLLGTTTTGENGVFFTQLPPTSGTSLMVEASGGSYVDKARGTKVNLSNSDRLSAVFNVETDFIRITPLTHMASARALAQAKNGITLASAVSSANIGVAQQYNLDDIHGWTPINPGDSDAVAESYRQQRIYGLVLAGIDQQARNLDVRAIDFSEALADDISDGLLDGKKEGSPIKINTISGSSVTMAASTGTADVQSAINNYMASPKNKANIAAMSIPLHAVPVGINGAGLFYTTSTVLPAAVSGESYRTNTLNATGGTPPYKWTLKPGSIMPEGFYLNEMGIISGTAPILPAMTSMRITPPFTVTVMDSAGQKQDLELRITIIQPRPKLTLKSATCVVNKPCSVKIATATGGSPPYYFSGSFISFDMDMKVDLNGVLSGTPKKTGNETFYVFVVDMVGASSAEKTTVNVIEKAETVTPTVRPTGMEIRGKITDKDTGELVVGAVVKVAYQDEGKRDSSIVAYSQDSPVDSNGNNYIMYLPYYLPSNVLVSVDGGKKYLPTSKNTKIDPSLEQDGMYRIINFILTPTSGNVIVVDDQLHHLGDDSYTGSVNSQFQLSTEGSRYGKSFIVDAGQLDSSQAILRITSKGAQNSNKIALNGQNIGSLCCSPEDGSFGTLEWTFDAKILKEGANSFTINSVSSGQSGTDIDDFEFNDIIIELEI